MGQAVVAVHWEETSVPIVCSVCCFFCKWGMLGST